MRTLHESEMWHLKAPPYTSDGIAGVPVIQTSKKALGKAIAVDDYGARFFANGAVSGGVIKNVGTFDNDEQKEQFIASWRRARTGVNAHKDALLEFGMDYVPGAAKNNEAQFLETLLDTAIAITRIWNIPPHEVGILEGAKFRNIEQQAIAFITKTMLPWFVLWEQRIGHDLVIPSAQLSGEFFFEFNLAGLLRGDLKSRYEAYHIGRQGGWLSVNEIRRLENMNGIEGGDTFLEPMNMQDAAAAAGAGKDNDPDDDDDADSGEGGKAIVTDIRRQA